MKKITLSLLCCLSLATLKAQNTNPKLVVGIVVDQMKQEYLWRFENDFGTGGFKRLMHEGFMAKNAHYNYATTSTGPGHASIYTGTTPSIHGIVNNSWYSRLLKRGVYCAEDTTANAVGGSVRNGRISPANLYSSTITDELKMFTQQQAKVVAMSIKDRGSALPGGHLSDGSYWYDSQTGNFMTSTYYMKTLPEWVSQFNDRKLADEYLNNTWTLFLPEENYTESGEDNSKYEGGFRGKENPTFPYHLAQLREQNGNFGMLPSTPWGNTILTELALASLEGESLGEDEVTDFLAISYSSTDYIGHNFGPQSKEVQDTYVRLDREIERLLNKLDEKLGKGNYVVFLSADHAVAENSIRMKELGFRADNFGSRNFSEYLSQAMNERFGEAEWFENTGMDIFFNHSTLKTKGVDLYEAQLFVAQHAMQFPGIYLAVPGIDLTRNSYESHVQSLIQNAYHPKESGDVKMVMEPAWQWGGAKGTGHGNPWAYDTHIPIMFYGWGIEPGTSVRPIHITDIAPTISMLLNIRMPSGTTGQPISEALK
ncbi:alkaline phosphatase PafA [Roseivirga sp. UBA1976]|jgi:predicted AlkP superfamily pyrophosphatase or phosphodiesterase|uniref:alkaline phosphatase PafA n=1 Tax=Roseivirga sp. UBA1976 TaxID=1947386 RepID=UPI00257DF265|nr:alkaline phosphatase PafA [Roseivirga sp. UBA1976]|tara:strand:- start:741 stop:2360 length:1620 start_codon:yes stop_codon:yes gene_type:complete